MAMSATAPDLVFWIRQGRDSQGGLKQWGCTMTGGRNLRMNKADQEEYVFSHVLKTKM